jgi:NADPH:quinone reductase-like Zn-dependent oxidoreductase
VTGVTSSRNDQLVRDLGAERVIDHTTTDVAHLTERYDLVLDTVGNLTATTGRRVLTPDGVLLLAAADLWQLIGARGNVRAGSAPEKAADIELLLGLVATGTLTVVIDQVVPLDGIADGYRLVDSGRKVGNVVIRPQRP